MPVSPRAVAAAAVALLVAGCALGDRLVQGPSGPQAPLPTLAPGERWVRDDGIFELSRVERDVYVFSASGGSELHYARNLALLKYQSAGGAIWEFQPALTLDWPLQTGKRGTMSGRVRIPNSGDGDGWTVARFSWDVEAYEDVQTAAGPFKAYRILVAIEPYRASSAVSRLEYRTWYAPAARQYIKTASTLWGLAFQVVSVDRSEETPLQVTVHEPRDDTRSAVERTTVVGRVTGGGGVAGVSVSVNGVRVSTDDPRAGVKETVALSVPVKLNDGRNVVLVTATDRRGNTRQEARVVFYDKPALPKPRTASAPPPAVPPPAPRPPVPAPPVGRAPVPAVSPPPPEPPAARPMPTTPVEIAIPTPANQTKFDHDSVILAGYVTGGKGVRRVVVALNGKETWRNEEPGVQRAVALTVPITLREGQNTIVVTATEADNTPYQEVRTVYFERRVPLAVELRYPPEGLVASQSSSVVVAGIRTSQGVAKVTLVVNGVVVPTSDAAPGVRREGAGPALAKEMALTVPITLVEGNNVVVVRAEEPDGTAKQEVRTVTYTPPPPAISFAPSTPAAVAVADRWAVIIGISAYDAPGITKLRYTTRDAEAIYRILTGPGGFKKDHVVLLTDHSERKPTLRNIKWALGTFLQRSAKPEDTVLIFFAGHGGPEPDQNSIEQDGLAKYLIPLDADPDDLYSTAFPMDEIQNVFTRIKAERTVMFVDACYSGATGGRTFSAKKTRATTLDEQFLERVTRSRGRAIVTAARPSEVAMELDELGHGIFTYYLVRGIEGAADANRDGVVTLQELYEYVEREVSNKARSVGGRQQPLMKGELEGSLPLFRVDRSLPTSDPPQTTAAP